MNAMPEKDVFEIPTHFIVGGTSQTGREQTGGLMHWPFNVIATWSREVLLNQLSYIGGNTSGILTNLDIGLPLKNKNSIHDSIVWKAAELEIKYWKRRKTNQWDQYWTRDISVQRKTEWQIWIADEVGHVLTFGQPVDLTLHAMAMSGMSTKYPQEVVRALEESNAEVWSVLYISYEAWYWRGRPGWSHVYYPVRKTKDQMEASALAACRNAKIVDLITFDSPSAKKLWFTFLWIVGDFIMFIEKYPENDISNMFQDTLKDFLWEDYQWIQDLFAAYPLRWSLSEWQESMKKMWDDGTLNTMISKAAKKLNFAKFSRISGDITNIYLWMAMRYMNIHRESILKENGKRVLLDWERITEGNFRTVFGDINIAHELLEEKIAPVENSQTPEWVIQNTVFQTWKTKDDIDGRISYSFDPSKLDFLGNHFGIIPYFLMTEMVQNSWLMQKGEFIKLWKPSSMLYSWNTIVLTREWDSIKIINDENPKEIFCDFSIARTDTMGNSEPTEKWFIIPQTEKEKAIDEWSFPHSLKWWTAFRWWIPSEFEWVSFSKKSALIEHLWFQVANLLLNEPNSVYIDQVKGLFSRMSSFDPCQISGKFGKVTTEYESPELEEALNWWLIPTVKITQAAFSMGNLNISLESLDEEGNILTKHKFMFA